jgi:hypothetical protein
MLGTHAYHRSARYPRWLTVLGVVALAEQVIETITIFGRTGFTAPDGPSLFLGAVLTLAWFTALGIVLVRRGAPAPLPTEEAAAVR